MLHTYLEHWRRLNHSARLYLIHAALLTGSLGIISLFFNLAILALGYSRSFLGLLNSLSIGVAALLSLPLWWLVVRLGLRWGLLANALLQVVSAFVFALWPIPAALLLAVGLTGAASVLFQVSSPPFMMEHSDDSSRDQLFSANSAVNISIAGLSTLLAGGLPALFGGLLGSAAESGIAYRATFGVAGCGLLLSLVPLLLIRDGRAQGTDRAPQNRDPQTDRESTQTPAQPLGGGLLKHIPAPYRELIRRPGSLVRLLVPPFLISWGAALLIPYLNLFFKERFAIPDSVLGLIFAALGITTGLAALAAPLISTRIGKIATVALTQALSIPFLLLMGFAPLLGLAVGAALVRQALFNMGSPLYDAFAMERTEAHARPIVIGLINGAYTAGYLLGPSISTWTQERYGFGPLFIATAVCYSLAALANYMFFVRR